MFPGFGGGGFGGMGGMGGNPLGAMGMDLSLHKMPLIGGFFVNPQEQYKQAQFSQAGRAYGAYRPELAQARMNALRNAASAFQGANNAMATMYGGGGSVQPGQMFRNPMSPTMMQQGQSMPGTPMGMGGGMMGGGFPGLGGMMGGSPFGGF